MASNYKQNKVIQGDGDPEEGDGLCLNLSLFPIGSIYINNTTGKLWSRDADAGVVADWVSQSGGSIEGIERSGDDLVYTADTHAFDGIVAANTRLETPNIIMIGNGATISLKSADGTLWSLGISDAGELVITED